MTRLLDVRIPELGTDEQVEVVDVLVSDGQRVEKENGLITLESDKASMDVPSPADGLVIEIHVRIGDRVEEGDLILRLEVESSPDEDSDATPPAQIDKLEDEPAAAPAARASTVEPAPWPTRPDVSTYDTELLVIGGGPGGYTSAFRAADLGLDVTLVERYPSLGGVCLNVGCIPSKALLHVARVIDEAAFLSEHGVEFGTPRIDLDRLRAWKTSVVERLSGGLVRMAEQRGVTVVQGSAHFVDPHAVAVASTEGSTTISFAQGVVAAGSRVIELPGIPHDDPRVMDSTDALVLEEIPDRFLLVGGGIVGLEMAMVYGALGAEITIVELLDGLVPGCDRDLVRPLQRRLEKVLGATIFLETRVEGIDVRKKTLVAKLRGDKAPDRLEIERVLVAVGRRPNGDRLHAEAGKLAVDEKGFIAVDRQMRTNVPHLFAIGDITGHPMLAHKATHQGKVAAEVAAGQTSAFDARVIPSVAYTDPEIAWVGLTETEAKETGVAYASSSFPWAASGRALGMGRGEGKTKLLFDPESKRILGGGIVGPSAGDLIAEVALALEMDCEASDIGLTVHPHPTLSETVAFAAEAFEGTITDLYLGKRRKS